MTRAEVEVLVRADAGMGIGFGHLTRCLAVSRHLTERGVSVTVATRAALPAIIGQMNDAGAKVLSLPAGEPREDPDAPVWTQEAQRADAAEVISQAPPGGWDALIVDHYQLDSVWESEVAPITKRTIAIDDLANRSHKVDVLVDQNWYGIDDHERYAGLVDDETLLLLGPRYAMLHHEYAVARERRGLVSNPPRSVMVSFGGTDVGQQTAKAVVALAMHEDVGIEVVLGTELALTDKIRYLSNHPRVRLHIALPNLVRRMSEVDLVIGAGGTATWERICMGVPAIVTTVSENQSGVTKALHKAGVTRWLGTSDVVTDSDYSLAVTEALSGKLPTVLPIVDGYGAGRVAMAVLPPTKLHVTARPARPIDAPAFVTAGGFSMAGPKVWKCRLKKFTDLLTQGDELMLLMAGALPMGIQERSAASRWIEESIDSDALPKEFT